MVGVWPFVCVHLQQHAVSGNVTFIRGLACVCRVTSVFSFFSHPPSGPCHVPSSPHSPGREPSHRRHCKHLVVNTEERGLGWRTSISTFHILCHNVSMDWFGLIFTSLGFVSTFFSMSEVCKRWTISKPRKIWFAHCSLDFTKCQEMLAFRCH